MKTGHTHGSSQRDPREVKARFFEFSLASEVTTLHEEPGWDSSGKNARTLVEQDSLRVTLIALKAGAGLKEHDAPGPVSIQLISGAVRVGTDGEEHELDAGQLVVLAAAVPHSVTALEDAVILLTISKPQHQS